MAYQAVESVKRFSKASGGAYTVMLILATHADSESFACHPSRELLLLETRLNCERTLQRHLSVLEESGELSIQRGNGRGNLTQYTIKLPRDKKGDKSSEKVTSVSPFTPRERVTKKGDIQGRERVTPASSFEQERVTSGAIKGDKSSCAYKDIEPSGNSFDSSSAKTEQRDYQQKAAAKQQQQFTILGRFEFAEYLAYVQAKNPEKQIAQATGLANWMRRNGQDDEAVAAWKAAKSAPARAAPKRCGKCNGRGDYLDGRKVRVTCDCPAGREMAAMA